METEMIFTWKTGVALVAFLVLVKPASRLFLRLTAKLNPPPVEPMTDEDEASDIIGSDAWEPKKK